MGQRQREHLLSDQRHQRASSQWNEENNESFNNCKPNRTRYPEENYLNIRTYERRTRITVYLLCSNEGHTHSWLFSVSLFFFPTLPPVPLLFVCFPYRALLPAFAIKFNISPRRWQHAFDHCSYWEIKKNRKKWPGLTMWEFLRQKFSLYHDKKKSFCPLLFDQQLVTTFSTF